jgi:hypothetical protein
MKKVSAMLFAFVLVATTFANAPIVNEKVLKTFEQTFSNAEGVKWEEYESHYSVSFKHSGVQTKVTYKKNGEMLTSISYYAPKMLPLYLQNKLKKDYPGMNLYGVTEVMHDDTVTYFVKLENEKNWVTVKVDPTGSNEVVNKYRKA